MHRPVDSRKYGALWVGVIDADALVTVGDADSELVVEVGVTVVEIEPV